MSLVENIQQKSFLGAEFATWLWYRSETADGRIDLPGGRSCEVAFERDIVLTSEGGEAVASALKGETPAFSPEAATALHSGKKIKRARLRIVVEDTTWELTLNAENFDWSGLKIDTPAEPSLRGSGHASPDRPRTVQRLFCPALFPFPRPAARCRRMEKGTPQNAALGEKKTAGDKEEE